MRTVLLGFLLGFLALNNGLVAIAESTPATGSLATPQKQAKNTASARSDGRSSASKVLFIDSVVASVNDSSILQSKLFKASLGEIQGAIAEGRNPTLNQIRGQTMIQLRKLVTDYQMAQSARSFGNFPTERFDAILKSELDRDQQDRVRELGTEFAYSEELARTGETWQTHREELRLEKLTMLAEQFAIYERLRKQSNLYLTPRMLRETYKKYESEFVTPNRANVAMIVCSGPNALANASKAADFWQTGDWTAQEVANRCKGVTPAQSLPAKLLEPKLKAFGLAGPIGNVSPPTKGMRGTYKVVKIMQWQAANEGRFEDPRVQAIVRNIASKQVQLEFRQQAQERARDRTKVWVYENGRRQALGNR